MSDLPALPVENDSIYSVALASGAKSAGSVPKFLFPMAKTSCAMAPPQSVGLVHDNVLYHTLIRDSLTSGIPSLTRRLIRQGLRGCGTGRFFLLRINQ
jgi:hypothetical protein